MAIRTVPLVSGEYYHVFNRGVEKRDIFSQGWDYKRFVKTIYYYQFQGPKPSFSKLSKSAFNLFKPKLENKIADILCYCLMPNHFHFLVKQIKENGISEFIGQLSNSYTKYFNTKYERVGSLLQGPFKAVRIETEEQLIHVSRYIHLNPVVAGLVKHLEEYPWSSYLEYINEPIICIVSEILNIFPSKKKYKKFVEDRIDYGTTLEILKHQVINEL